METRRPGASVLKGWIENPEIDVVAIFERRFVGFRTSPLERPVIGQLASTILILGQTIALPRDGLGVGS